MLTVEVIKRIIKVIKRCKLYSLFRNNIKITSISKKNNTQTQQKNSDPNPSNQQK